MLHSIKIFIMFSKVIYLKFTPQVNVAMRFWFRYMSLHAWYTHSKHVRGKCIIYRDFVMKHTYVCEYIYIYLYMYQNILVCGSIYIYYNKLVTIRSSAVNCWYISPIETFNDINQCDGLKEIQYCIKTQKRY